MMKISLATADNSVYNNDIEYTGTGSKCIPPQHFFPLFLIANAPTEGVFPFTSTLMPNFFLRFTKKWCLLSGSVDLVGD